MTKKLRARGAPSASAFSVGDVVSYEGHWTVVGIKEPFIEEDVLLCEPADAQAKKTAKSWAVAGRPSEIRVSRLYFHSVKQQKRPIESP